MNNRRNNTSDPSTLLQRTAVWALLLFFATAALSGAACRKKTIAEKEPNDRFSDATMIEAGIPVTGTLSSAADTDFFRLDIEESASFDVSLSAVKGVNHAIRVWKGESSGPLLAKLIDDVRKSSPERMCNLTLERGIWYFEITHGDRDIAQGAPDIPYILKITPQEAGKSEEKEPNDDIDHANAIIPETSVTGYYSPSFNKLSHNRDFPMREEDWYSFTVETSEKHPAIIRATLSGVPGITGAMELYDPDKTMQGRAEAANPGTPITIGNHLASKSGTWYLCVHSLSYESDCDHPYTLNLSFADFDPTKESEPNDSIETATKFNPSEMSGTINPSGDHDIYFFETDRPSIVSIELSVPPSLDITAAVYGKNKAAICETTASGGSTLVIPDIYADGQIFCELSALYGKTDGNHPYKIVITSSDYTPDMEKEPNDTRETATRFAKSIMKGYLTYKKDKDWFLYAPGKMSNRTLTVSGIEGAAFTVSVTDKNGYVVRTEKIAGKKPVSFKENFDGRGFIVIESQKEITTEPYSITIGK